LFYDGIVTDSRWVWNISCRAPYAIAIWNSNKKVCKFQGKERNVSRKSAKLEFELELSTGLPTKA